MKKIAAILLAALALAGHAGAAEGVAPAPAPAAVSAESAAAVKELLQAMNYRAVMKQSFEQMSKAMPNILRQQGEAAINSNTSLNEAQRKDKLAKMNAELPKVTAALQDVFNDPSLQDDLESELVPLYTRHFTAEDMRQMAAFYRTPAGIKAMQVMPQLMPEAMAISQRVTQPRILKVMQQFQKK